MSNILTLARVTAREVLGQPLTRIAAGASCLLLFVASFLPSFTLEEGGDLKFMSDAGLAAVALGLMVIGLWPAATLLADEIGQRTALTLLSKPLSRRDYLLGRYFGILGALLIAAVVLTAAFLGAVWLTEGEALTSRLDRIFEEAGRMHSHGGAPSRPLPAVRWGLGAAAILGLSQAAILCALALALSTRLAALPNLAACAGLFFLGHLIGPLARSWPAWLAAAVRGVVPDLELFDLSEAIARGVPIPLGYLAASAAYAALYAGAVLAAAVPLFERRELA